MPIYSYECSHCMYEFEEFHKSYKDSGKTFCIKCGNVAFKVPSVFNPKIFKKREFADGTTTPDHVNTPNQEKAWMKSQGITYDAPTGQEKRNIKEERKRKSKTVMELAFKNALQKAEQGHKLEGLKQKKPKKINFRG